LDTIKPVNYPGASMFLIIFLEYPVQAKHRKLIRTTYLWHDQFL
jgi:hypothetical protein